MSESKHTPEPWVWKPCGDFKPPYFELVGSDGQTIIGDGSRRGEYEPEIEPNSPNGLLIAAAPEMYAVLKSMESVDDDPMANGDTRRKALLAAIAKAEQ